MTASLTDPLVSDLLRQPADRISTGVQTARPFGLRYLTPNTQSHVDDRTGRVYDPHQQLNVTAAGEVAAFELPHAATHTTTKTVNDHQEWDDTEVVD